jgi:tetratricopeptide (TPR) repeat protein
VNGSGCRAVAAAAVALATSLCCSIAYAQSRDDWVKCLSTQQIPADERISSCTAALESGSSSSFYANRAYANRAMAYLDRGNSDGAIADIAQVIQRYPTNVYAYASRGFAYLQKGDFDRAIADYTRLIDVGTL